MAPKTASDLLQPASRWRNGARHLRATALAFLADLVSLGYLVVMLSFIVTQLSDAPSLFSVVPWWVVTLILSEICVAWEAFGVSIGLRLLGLEMPGAGRSRRLLWIAACPLTAITVIGLFAPLWDPQARGWPERLTGLRLRRTPPQTAKRTAWYRTSWGWGVALIVSASLSGGVFLTEINFDRFSWNAAARMLRRLFRPDWAGELATGLSLLKETIFMALMATLFAIPIAFSLSFLAARNLATGPVRRSIYTVLRVVLSIIRSIEPIVWAIIFLIIVEPRRAPFAGVLALWVHSISDLTKLYSERLESIDTGPVEAITATGASRLQVILYGIVPQILNPYLSFTLYRWDINVRMATIIGLVGGGGIGQMLYQYIRLHYWERAAVLIVLIILTVWVMDYTSSKLRQRFEEGGISLSTRELIRFKADEK
jgi:phosphonate transport system permease protein